MATIDYKLLLDDDDRSSIEKPKNDVENPADDEWIDYVLLQHHQKNDQETKKEFEARCLSYAKYYSLVTGLIMGCFIQAANLGIEMLILWKANYFTYPGMFVMEGKTMKMLYVSSMVISVAGASMLSLLRSLVESCLLAASSAEIGKSWEEEGFIYQFLMAMDCFFSIGVIFGVTCSWYLFGICIGTAHFGYDEGLTLTFCCVLWFCLATVFMSLAIAKRKEFLARKDREGTDSKRGQSKEETKVVIQNI